MEVLYQLSYGSNLNDINMAPQVGFEPTTNRLTADGSTTELLRNNHQARQRPTLARGSPLLPSALGSLTSVFGMRAGVTFPPSPPDRYANYTYTHSQQLFKGYDIPSNPDNAI